MEKCSGGSEGEGGGRCDYLQQCRRAFCFATLGDDADVQIPAVSITLEEGEVLLETALGEEVLLVCEDVYHRFPLPSLNRDACNPISY